MALKTQPTRRSPSAFIKAVKHEERRVDCLELLSFFEEITRWKPRMWGETIVGYGQYHYVYASGQEGDWPVTGFSPRAQNISIYIMPGFSKYDHLLQKLGKPKLGKSCLYVKKLSDIDLKILKRLIKQSVVDMKKMYPCKN